MVRCIKFTYKFAKKKNLVKNKDNMFMTEYSTNIRFLKDIHKIPWGTPVICAAVSMNLEECNVHSSDITS
jgi:hypothetical protein